MNETIAMICPHLAGRDDRKSAAIAEANDTIQPGADRVGSSALARQILGGPEKAGRSSYQVALTVCERCRKGWQHGQGELIEVSAETVEMAECDSSASAVSAATARPTWDRRPTIPTKTSTRDS